VPSTRVDLYGVLGVARSATFADLRRAYRRMALLYHPDRAGAASAPTFAVIADAYRVLSNPVARLAYDASLAEQDAWMARDAGTVHAGGMDWTVGTTDWKAARAMPITDLLPRVSGRLEALVSSRVVAIDPDGCIEVHLNGREAASGGTAAIQMALKLVCASCGGVARPRGVWCRICEYEGTVNEEVTVHIRVPPRTHPGSVTTISVPRVVDSPLQIRFFVHGLRPVRTEDVDYDE
jgi:molecular chaperone DnaJ